MDFSRFIMEFKGLSLGNNVLILTDQNVERLYLLDLKNSLISNGYKVESYVVPASESSKSFKYYEDIVNFLADAEFTREDTLICLGGGVVGDLGGFVAATYLRGISLVQMPTTLLAMIDSSIGGKTAIDLRAGKNLLGAFYNANLRYLDIEFLRTIPKDILRDGFSELIKCGILRDFSLIDTLLEEEFLSSYKKGIECILSNPCIKEKLKCFINEAAALKIELVKKDPYDFKERRFLNLGHSYAHAIEKLSAYKVSHGMAVGYGLYRALELSLKKGYIKKESFDKIIDVLIKYGFKREYPYSEEDIHRALRNDKKRKKDNISFIYIEDIGKCFIKDTPLDELID